MLCRNSADSEDLAQEALLKAMRNLDRFDPDRGTIDSWLWQIVINAARDAGRASTRAEALWARIALAQMATRSTDDVELLALRRLNDAELLAEVRRLPRRYRTLIALRFGAELNYQEIGALLHEGPAALRQSVRRALKALRIRLESPAHPYGGNK
jgi:RNA polymerase sigma-70 factor (ECF subfamily)